MSSGPYEKLTTELRELQRCRSEVASQKVVVEFCNNTMLSTGAGKKYVIESAIHTVLKEELADLEADVRSVALDIAVELNDKKPAPDVTVTKKTSFLVGDDARALQYCREELPAAVQVNLPVLKKLMLALPREMVPDFIIIEEEEFGQVRIARDLSRYDVVESDGDGDVPF